MEFTILARTLVMRVFLDEPQVRMDGFVTEEIGMDSVFSNTLYTCGEKGIIILG